MIKCYILQKIITNIAADIRARNRNINGGDIERMVDQSDISILQSHIRVNVNHKNEIIYSIIYDSDTGFRRSIQQFDIISNRWKEIT